MRALLAALLVLAVPVLAGCVTPPADDAAPAALLDALPPLVAFDGVGAVVPVPEELASGFVVKEVLLGHRGGEPNIGVTPKGNVFMTSNHNTMKSEDHGMTWKIVFNLSTALPQNCAPAPATPPPANCPITQFTRSSDPMLWVDPDTGRIFTNHMTGLYCSNMIISSDEGATWTMKPMTCGVPGNDHQKVATSKPGPKAPPIARPTYPNVVYYCYNKAIPPGLAPGQTNCAVSLDGGLNFAYERTVATEAIDGCGGINGHPAPHPDGTVFVPMTLGCAGPVVGVSEDNGLTWVVRKGPTEKGSEELDADITVTPDGTAYMLARGKDHLQYLYRSSDKFATWEGPWLASAPDLKSTVFAGITSGDDGRVAMSFLATRDSDEEPSKTPNATRWHLFVVYALDAAAESPTFVSQQVSRDADPVQIGCVWLNGGGNPCRNMLDFIDMTSDKEGRFYVAFTDGCTEGCANNATATNENSRARAGAVAVLVDGPSLVAATGRVTH